MRERFRGSRRGTFHGRDGNGREMMVATAVSIDAAGYRAEVAAIDDEDDEPIVIRTADRRIVQHHAELERAIQVKAYQRRPILSFWKAPAAAEPEPLLPVGMAPCPSCREFGEVWPDCGLCDGDGLVTERRLAEWRDRDSG